MMANTLCRRMFSHYIEGHVPNLNSTVMKYGMAGASKGASFDPRVGCPSAVD